MQVILAQLACSPLRRPSCCVVEIIDAQHTCHRRIMVPSDAVEVVGPQHFQALHRVRTVPDHVSHAPNPIEMTAIGKDGLQGLQVGVNVGQEQSLQENHPSPHQKAGVLFGDISI